MDSLRILFTTIIAAMQTVSSMAAGAVKYTPMEVPAEVDTSFKTYMDYRCITNRYSEQYRYIQTWAWCDYDGFMRADGEKDLGIEDNYYLVALGSYYGTQIGDKYRITTDLGNTIYAVLADCKADRDTDYTRRYSYNNDVVEFLVYTPRLPVEVLRTGSANTYMPLCGKITAIERIDFGGLDDV